ncbi:MAG: DUF3300 domain-containing protein [Acidiferrobacterales bacterium]|nr:DUF3300 domain-containing protein [Acidiferrobacterales bacterium]
MPNMTRQNATTQAATNAAISQRKRNIFYVFASLTLLAMMVLPMAKAQTVDHQVVQHEVVEDIPLNQAELDQILAPIALYPDSLLSQILVASTYPLEVIQATRWRQDNAHLDEDQVLTVVENKDWDPSVKALAPFEDLLVRISEDLEWLQSVGDAFLQNEDQVLASIQNLRQAAYDNGSIADSEYYQVVEEDDNIVIESTTREIVYVPYYDTRVVYGNWWWDRYRPVYWDRPRNYVHLSGGFYWNSGYYIRPRLFFGGFHWGSRRLVVNHYYYDDPYRYRNYGYDTYYNIHISNYRHWSHNPVHRRGVRYPEKVVKSYAVSNRGGSSAQYGASTVRKTNTVGVTNRSNAYQPNLRQRSVGKVQEKLSNTRPQASRNTSTSYGTSTLRKTNTATTRTTNRTVTSQPNLRERSVGNVQRNVSNNRQVTTQNSGSVDRRQPVRTNTQTVRPTVNNRTVTNRSVSVNKSATPQRSSPSVSSTQRNNTSLRQRTVTPKTTSVSKSSNRTTATTSSSSAAKAYSRTSSSNSSTTNKTTSNSNNGVWSRR